MIHSHQHLLTRAATQVLLPLLTLYVSPCPCPSLYFCSHFLCCLFLKKNNLSLLFRCFCSHLSFTPTLCHSFPSLLTSFQPCYAATRYSPHFTSLSLSSSLSVFLSLSLSLLLFLSLHLAVSHSSAGKAESR